MEAIVTGATNGIVEAVAKLFRLLVDPAPIIAVQRLFGGHPFWQQLFSLVSKLGDAQAAALVVLLLFWFRQRRLAYALIVAVALAAVTDVVLWHVVNAPRPANPRIVVREFVTVSSFPSGHTMTATAVWGTLAIEDEIPWGVAAFLIGAVMIARLYFGVHFGRDLLGALLIGGAWIALRRRYWSGLTRWFARHSPRSFLLPGIAVCAGALFALPLAPNRRWDILAMIGGAALGLTLEYAFVRFRAAPLSPAWTVGKLLLGFGGAAALYFAAQYAEEAAFPLAVGATMLLPLWGLLGAPTLFKRLAPLADHVPAQAVTEPAASQ
jgi:membrane-associated phospholipid phosphatase